MTRTQRGPKVRYDWIKWRCYKVSNTRRVLGEVQFLFGFWFAFPTNAPMLSTRKLLTTRRSAAEALVRRAGT